MAFEAIEGQVGTNQKEDIRVREISEHAFCKSKT